MKPGLIWPRCAEWAGVGLAPDQLQSLETFRQWLVDEAAPAGGIGPSEADRIETRHIGDSILFARCLSQPPVLVDFGSGAGLPGIPLAIALPETEVVLIDRAGRRVDLLRRVTRILDLPNIQVIHGDIDAVPTAIPAIVSRATFSPATAEERLAPRLGPGGVLVLGGSWVSRPTQTGWTTVEVPRTILDQEVWILMMRAS